MSMIIALVIIGVVVLGVVWLVVMYNGLISGRTRVQEGLSDIEVQLNRRYDLIPNLVNTVKGYAKHEDDVFTKVTQARTAAMSASTPHDHAVAENQLSQTLKSLFAVAEAYPDLKASNNFAHLQTELVDTEDKIQAARRFYNSQVRDFNTSVQTFPTNLIANTLGFKVFEFYDAPEAANATPQVQF
ncbi:MAG: LemA family protein [Patescibacteria group bacterium]